ncbi:DUF257 family protein [Pyrococcus horikoshii]|uniref:KaiC-like domain-containing protein n=2 Tax=Pyrococcus horikoshii TaxID=53953 RepID=O58432_PYRHO|nr:DUF257 family protein [Pyrococcus horikoshii]BAA29792.1 236aa long hypothetical protein [Pyrococcus horikoshii OT3]HII61358.1 DUF257 family protein [Pyrococcus horikoshii]
MEETKQFEAKMLEHISRIFPGGIDIIEYESPELTPFLFYLIVKRLKERNSPIIILDILDQLHVIRTLLELSGIKPEIIDESEVIKLGGFLKTGKVIERIDVHKDIMILRDKFLRTIQELTKNREHVILIGIGAEKMVRIYERDPMEFEYFFALIGRAMLGDKRLSRIIFLNKSLLDKKTVIELEELASRVFEIKLIGEVGIGRELAFRIKKSLHFNEYGEEIRIKVQDFQKHLQSI